MEKRFISIFTALCMLSVMTVTAVAANTSYTFKGANIAKPAGTEEVTDLELTKDISVTTSGDLNWKVAAITDAAHNSECGFYPIGGGFQPNGSYVFLATGSTNDNTIITLNLPKIAAGSRVTLTYAKPIITNNGGTRRNENDPYAYFKIADRYVSINGGEFDKFMTKSVVISEATDKLDFVCNKWGAVAIQKIEISKADASELHKLNLQTERYSNVTVNGIKLCADENGLLDAGAFEEGEAVNITARKDGYKDAETFVTIGNSDTTAEAVPMCERYAAYYESDFGVPSGTLTFSEGKQRYYINTPAENITKLFGEVTFKGEGSLTVYGGEDNPITVIARRNDGIYANGEMITAKDNMEFEITYWQNTHKAILTQNGENTVINDGDLPEFSELSSVLGSTNSDVPQSVTMSYIGTAYPNGAPIKLEGPDTVSVMEEGMLCYDYDVVFDCPVPDGELNCQLSCDDEETVYLAPRKIDGTAWKAALCVKKGAPDKVTIAVGYSGMEAVNTTKEVTIAPAGKITEYETAGSVLNLYSRQKFELLSATDANGHELCNQAENVGISLRDFQSSDESVIKIDKNGYMTAVGKGKATISANAYTGVDNIVSARYTVDGFQLRGETGEQAAYEENILVKNENITGYKIIYYDMPAAEEADIMPKSTEDTIEPMEIPAAVMDEDGTLVTAKYAQGKLYSTETRAVKAGDKTEISTENKRIYLVNNNGIKKITEATDSIEGFKIEPENCIYEISPVYTFHNVGDVKEGKKLDALFVPNRYNITFKKGEAWRGDIFVNGCMVGNNVDQADADRKLTEGSLYTAGDIPVTDGSITVSMEDGSTMLDYVTVEQAPLLTDKRIFVIGDSLACEYYGDFEKEVGGGRSGWGQQLDDFVNVPVTNLANSGQFAAGLYRTAFSGVINHAERGDILLIECGYNDRNYSNRAEMTECVKAMIGECRAKGIEPILVTPNASKHDYKESVAWSGYLRDIAIDTDCKIIDLSKMSYDFLYGLYGDDKDNVVTMNYNLTAVGGDTLHSSYAGAYVWASIIAQGLKDMGYGDLTDESFEYKFTDTLGNEITAKVK